MMCDVLRLSRDQHGSSAPLFFRPLGQDIITQNDTQICPTGPLCDNHSADDADGDDDSDEDGIMMAMNDAAVDDDVGFMRTYRLISQTGSAVIRKH